MGGLSGFHIFCVNLIYAYVQCLLQCWPFSSVTLMKAIFSGPGRFTITSVTVGAGRDLINVTFVQVSHVTCDDYALLSPTLYFLHYCLLHYIVSYTIFL